VIDRFGHRVLNITDPKLLQGVWDLTVNDLGPFAQVFVSNALTGAVTRIDLLVLTGQDTVHVLDMTQIASGYAHPANSGAVVLAPTGLAFDAQTDTLYVASTGDNAIYAVANAAFTHNGSGKGTVVFNDPAILNGPLGLALAANGDLLTTNGDAFNPNFNGPPSALIEFTPAGHSVGQLSLDPATGSAFGLATTFDDGILTVATVNDDSNKNTLDLRTITQH
jgi:sugar lactone lactonase YvrE